MRLFLSVCALSLAATLPACSPVEEASARAYAPKPVTAPFYSVREYNPNRDVWADLQMTIETAFADDKRILLVVGGEWCIWCHYLADYLETDMEAQKAFEETFIVMKVNYSDENKNEDFLSQYPDVAGYPHFIILDSDGTFIGEQGTADLERGKAYNREKMLAFAEKWRKTPAG